MSYTLNKKTVSHPKYHFFKNQLILTFCEENRIRGKLKFNINNNKIFIVLLHLDLLLVVLFEKHQL